MSDDRWLATTLSVGAAVVGAVVAFRRQLAQRAPVAQSLQHQVHVVTGANTGLGFATSRELAKRGASVVMVCRSREKCDAAAGRVRRALAAQRGAVAGSVTTATCDLASRASITEIHHRDHRSVLSYIDADRNEKWRIFQHSFFRDLK